MQHSNLVLHLEDDRNLHQRHPQGIDRGWTQLKFKNYACTVNSIHTIAMILIDKETR